MKNTIKLLGIAAFIAVIGFSMAACGDSGKPSTHPADTYTTFVSEGKSNATISAIVGAAVPTTLGQVIIYTNKSRADALATCNTNLSVYKETGIKYSEIVELLDYLKTELNISTADVTAMENKLKNDGWGVAVVGQGGGVSSVVAAFKE
jgi:hypothetical protein